MHLRAFELHLLVVCGVASGTCQQGAECWGAAGECSVGSEDEPSEFISLLQQRSSRATEARRPFAHETQAEAGARGRSICLHNHALPQLYLLGPQKSGTTTVASDLFAGGVRDARSGKHCDDWDCKELHTFENICGYDPVTSKPKDGKSRCALMTRAQKQEWVEQFQLCTSDNALLADMTPANLRLPDLAPMMADLYGEFKSSLRFIILLRNPVARMHSGFYHELQHDNFNGHMDFITMDFTTWLQEEVMPRVERFNTNQTIMETDARMDQFYRSLMSVQLKSWLDTFNPSQFMLVPSSLYFQNAKFRQKVWRQMSEKWGFILQEPLKEELRHDNQGFHPRLEKDSEPSVIQELNSKYFYPDAVNLAKLLSKVIPMGFTLSGYTGPPDSAFEIRSFLQSVDYPSADP
mmetsp:Transcript_28913/g.52869  ORF Transcript_28913/g.52869 Transcript_28913/m.52869 type:complete len:407 (+) Transcript_28913:64-1284(+)